MIRIIFLVVTLILGAITVYCYFTDKSKSASIISTFLTILSLVITIYPNILEQGEINPNIVLDDNKLELFVGDEYILNAFTSPDNSAIKWNSNSEIVTINDNGHLKAINEGRAQISATITYKKVTYTDSCEVIIKVPEINLDSSCLINIEETKELSVVTVPDDINIIWSSNDINIVTVNDNGKIRGLLEGTAIITATMTYNNINYSADCIVTVEQQSDKYNKQNNDDVISNEQEAVGEEVPPNNGLQESEINSVSLSDFYWFKSEKAYKNESATTVRGKQWLDCIRFGSSNLNADGNSIIKVDFDESYSRFTAEIAPQEGFDESEEVIVYIYGFCNGEQTFVEDYSINYETKSIPIDIDITDIDEFCIEKVGNYNQARIALQYINGYSGMGVLMRDATLYK